MNTRFSARGLLFAALAFTAGACATPSSPEDARSIAVDLTSGGHVRIWSAYLRAGRDEAVVRGMVRAEPLWRGPVSGHLHVTAYGRNEEVLARRSVRWPRQLSARSGASVAYQSALGVPRAQVARLAVAYAPGVHNASESFQ